MRILPDCIEAVGYMGEQVIFACRSCGQTVEILPPILKREWLDGQIKYRKELQEIENDYKRIVQIKKTKQKRSI